MSTELFERKIRTLFSRFDIDNSGSIEETDFDQWGDKLISFGNYSIGIFFLSHVYMYINTVNHFKGNLQDEQIDSLRKSLKKVWQKIFCPIDVNSDGNVSCDELTSYVKDVI